MPPLRLKHRLFQDAIIAWYQKHGRTYPWRQTQDPYKVLMAEFMLQRTGASQTVSVFSRFSSEFPTLEKLATASPAHMSLVLRPLGRVGRAAQLLKAVHILKANFRGRVPKAKAHLLKIPGVGEYTARAVLLFAFGKRIGIFDPNIARLLARVFNVRSSKLRPHTDPLVWDTVDKLVPRKKIREYSWGLIDFATVVCRPVKPRCAECPLSKHCSYFRSAPAFHAVLDRKAS